MSDFTLAELAIILYWGKERTRNVIKSVFDEEGSTAVYHKISNMIINLCEHDPMKTHGAIGMYHCPDCGEMQLAGLPHIRNIDDTKSDNMNNQT